MAHVHHSIKKRKTTTVAWSNLSSRHLPGTLCRTGSKTSTYINLLVNSPKLGKD